VNGPVTAGADCKLNPALVHASTLIQLLAGGDLSGLQKRFDEFTVSADGHAGKFLEPLAARDFRLGVKPIRQKSELISENLSAGDTVKQMVEEAWRQTVASNSRHDYSP
jgi:hypothetical protein